MHTRPVITILRCIKANILFPHHLGRGKKKETSREGKRKSYDGRLLRAKKKKIKVEHVRREEGEKKEEGPRTVQEEGIGGVTGRGESVSAKRAGGSSLAVLDGVWASLAC